MLEWEDLRDIYVVTTLFLRNFTYVLIMLMYSYVKTPYLTHQTFRTHQSTIKTLEKGLIFVRKLAMKIPERRH